MSRAGWSNDSEQTAYTPHPTSARSVSCLVFCLVLLLSRVVASWSNDSEQTTYIPHPPSARSVSCLVLVVINAVGRQMTRSRLPISRIPPPRGLCLASCCVLPRVVLSVRVGVFASCFASCFYPTSGLRIIPNTYFPNASKKRSIALSVHKSIARSVVVELRLDTTTLSWR